tara:strand:+ start:996 stop:1172 length:177 start_codon:yes stop_codon:yes gene_type:complete
MASEVVAWKINKNALEVILMRLNAISDAGSASNMMIAKIESKTLNFANPKSIKTYFTT